MIYGGHCTPLVSWKGSRMERISQWETGEYKMAENKTKLKLDALPEQIRDSMKDFADKLTTELGENLQSITVVGSSLTADYRPGQSIQFEFGFVFSHLVFTSLN